MSLKHKIVIRLHSGLANRMFQYAYYLYLQQKGYDVRMDSKSYRIFHVHEDVDWQRIFPHAKMREASAWTIKRYGGGSDLISKVRRHVPHASQVWWRMKNPTFRLPTEEELRKRPYIIGFFQRADMVEQVEERIRKDLQYVPFEPNSPYAELAQKLASEESVAIHVRKGKDYSVLPYFHNTCPESYYAHAIEYMKQHLKSPRFYVFTENPEWVKQHLPGDYECIGTGITSGWGNHFDMQLMSCCKHNIIANSTYSWWGAYLNPNLDKIVILPKYWFNPKLYPDPEDALQAKGWISLD